MVELNNENTGKVAWFDARRGVGFVIRDNGEKDLFVHWSNIDMDGFKTLKAGQIVSFEIGENHRGPQAVSVKVLREPEEEE
jgi:CspA family cold shock protein